MVGAGSVPPWSAMGVDGSSPPGAALTLHLDHIVMRRGSTLILDDVSFAVRRGERWLVLGANGSGKTSLLRIAALYEHPTSGTVDVLGERLGRTDVRVLRRRVGYASAALADQLRPTLRALDVVRTARYAALEPWWHRYTPDDDERAQHCLDRMGVGRFADRQIETLSSGERQRVLLARTLMNDPAVVLLDEPSARLDLGGCEQLVEALDELAADPQSPPSVVVTHHVDDIPPSTTHALLMRGGRILRAGPIEDVLDGDGLSETFGLALELERRSNGRFSAWARR